VTRRLDEAEFLATMGSRMRNVTEHPGEALDIWPYVDSVPAHDLEDHSINDGLVESVYRSEDGRFDHVLVITSTKNVYLVIVVDRVKITIHGHCLLDLNREYGLS
jgi:hypothetical protein